jgi:Mn2+/Fe2+ NRAMP family transporter
MRFRELMRTLGPGLAIAATGVGAGDLMAALMGGAKFGTVILWAVALGALFKFALNEGVARWQLATGTPVLEGWCRHLGRPFQIYFLVYLTLWSFLVAGGLMSACGVAAQALVGQGSVAMWAVVHSLVAAALVLAGRYTVFENVMKVLIAVMVVTLLGSVALLAPAMGPVLKGLFVPRLPTGSAASLLSLMGGVGGSVTLLSYGYWMTEKGWRSPERLGGARMDLGVGYLLTGLFGVAMLVLAAQVLGGAAGGLPPGSQGLVACADAVRDAASPRFGAGPASTLRLVFLVGIWGAVFTSTLGVWQGVPYLFADYWDSFRGRFGNDVDVKGLPYRLWLFYLAIPPMVLLAVGRPMWVIQAYTVASGLFLPLLAGSLLWMNGSSKRVGTLRNGPWATASLVLALVLFGAILVRQLLDLI